MGGTGRKNEPPKPADDKPKKPERAPVEDDDYEHGANAPLPTLRFTGRGKTPALTTATKSDGILRGPILRRGSHAALFMDK
jgi:hypothetical protein